MLMGSNLLCSVPYTLRRMMAFIFQTQYLALSSGVETVALFPLYFCIFHLLFFLVTFIGITGVVQFRL